MKLLHLLAASAIMTMLPAAPAPAADRAQPSVFGPRSPPPRDHHGGGKHWGRHRFGGGIWVIEREVPVIVEREVVVREVAAPAPPPPPAPRQPYVLGKSYASLPASCMKLIEGGASYYYCGSGEWYRAVGKRYLAIAR